MAPGLSANNTTNLEETVAKVYETLKRIENRNLDSKRRATRTLENDSKFFDKTKQHQRSSQHIDRFSESLDRTRYTAEQKDKAKASAQYSTLGNTRTSERLQQQRQRQSISSSGKVFLEDAKTSPVSSNNSKLKNIIFKTLDRLFQIPNKPSLQSQNNGKSKKASENTKNVTSLTLETLKLLNQDTEDTLPRRSSASLTECIITADKTVNTLSSLNNDDDESLSDDDSCWEFITPLKFEEVELEDTFERSTSKQSGGGKGKENEPVLGKQNGKGKVRCYQKQQSKRGSGKSKISQRALERQSEKMRREIQKPEELVVQRSSSNNTDTPKAKTAKNTFKPRPDSPINKKKECLSSAVSLPNLIEIIQELHGSPCSTISDCGTDTFTRNISYCASSTLCKSTPSFAANHEYDDEACSTSSSFSSLQIASDSTTSRSAHESTLPVPSALCKNILVRPISVSIQPFPQEGIVVAKLPQEKLFSATLSRNDDTEPVEPVNNHNKGDANFGIAKVEKKTTTSTSGGTAQQGFGGTGTSKGDTTLATSTVNVNHEYEYVAKLKQESSASSRNTTVAPPPPPIPPPPPPLSITTTATIRGLLPLPIFTQRQTGNCVFNQLKNIRIDEVDKKRLHEQFPLKSGSKALKRNLGKDKSHELSAGEKNFLRNIELFLRTCRISNDMAGSITSSIVKSFQTLNIKTVQVEVDEWFITLAQTIPKVDETEKMRNLQKVKNKTAAGVLASELLSIEKLHVKLSCIQFSLDFKEGSSKLLNWTESFISACDAIRMSDKFVEIINVIMGLLQSLSPDEQSQIYGFDIQGLTKLSTRISEDGSTTFLEFVIEYILSRPDLIASIDFYKAFKDFPDISKTSINEMKVQCQEWQQSLDLYRTQVKQIQKNKQISSRELEYSTMFLLKTDIELRQLETKLVAAQESFNGCKERFGLMNSETTEAIFFESLSKFVITYQNTYKKIIAQKEKASKQNAAIVEKIAHPEVVIRRSGNISSRQDIITRRKSCSGIEIQRMRNAAAEKTKNPPIANPRRKSYSPKEIQDMLDAPSATEMDKCFVDFLMKTDNENGNVNRVRKRVSTSSSKIPVRQ